MDRKQQTQIGYSPEETEVVHNTCLFLATKLHDLMPSIRIVGGLVPSLIIGVYRGDDRPEPHVGTNDLDLGFELGILEDERYREIGVRLRDAGFRPDTNDDNNETRQRWVHPVRNVKIDFLIPPVDPTAQGGKLQNLDADLAAIVTPGLNLAFEDFEKIRVSGPTGPNERAARDIWVCGPAAYIVLKALAFRNRGKNKDAYDLFYVLKNWSGGMDDLVLRWRRFGDSESADKALGILEEDFRELDSTGPARLNEFFEGEGSINDELRADSRELVQRFVSTLNPKD